MCAFDTFDKARSTFAQVQFKLMHRGLAVTKREGGVAVNAGRLEFLRNELASVS